MPVSSFSSSGQGDDFYEKALSGDGRGACSPEHRWLCAIRGQGKGSSPRGAGRYERLVVERTGHCPAPSSLLGFRRACGCSAIHWPATPYIRFA
jgi:hypothetical protein